MGKLKVFGSFIALVFFFGAVSQAFALDVPRSDNARPAGQASTGLATASSSSSTADSHVPS